MKRKNTKLSVDDAVELARAIMRRGHDVELRVVGRDKVIVYEVHKTQAVKEDGG